MKPDLMAISCPDRNGAGISLTTFPPGVAPQTQNGVQYDYTGANVGSWYGEIDVE
jgi:hypothetical protein